MKIPLNQKTMLQRSIFVWTQDLNYTLIIIENDNPLSTSKETTIAFQAKHPNLNLTFEIFTIEEQTWKNTITYKTPKGKKIPI